MKLTVKVAIIIAVIIIPSTVLFLTLDTGMQDTSIDDSMELSGEIKIGAILPLTGDLSSHGEENLEGTKLGVADFNEYLAELEEQWSIKLVVEDSATSPVIALEKITTLNSKGISIVIGPETSANIRNIKGYSDSNNMLIVSCCSTAPSLAIPNDSVYRLLPDDSKQGTALGRLLEYEGIQVMIPVYRADTWGDGLSETTINSFEGRGGQVGEGIRYNPESPEFSVSTSLLAQEVQSYVDEYGENNVAILFLGFGEILQFMQSASEHDVLDKVKWFGPGANTKESKLIDDSIGLDFSTNVQFTTVQVASSQNEVYQHVQDYVFSTLGRIPNSYTHSSYDAVWLVGLAILEAQSTDVDMIKKILPEIAENYSGAIGVTRLNDAGDLDHADYEIWGIRGDKWILLGKYTQSDDNIVLTDSTI